MRASKNPTHSTRTATKKNKNSTDCETLRTDRVLRRRPRREQKKEQKHEQSRAEHYVASRRVHGVGECVGLFVVVKRSTTFESRSVSKQVVTVDAVVATVVAAAATDAAAVVAVVAVIRDRLS